MKNIAILALVLSLSSTDARILQRAQDPRFAHQQQHQQMEGAESALMRSRDSNQRAQDSLNRMISDRHHAVSQFRDPAGEAAAKAESDSGDSGSDSDSGDESSYDPKKRQQQRLKKAMQDSKKESKQYKKFKPVKRDADGKPLEQKSTDEELDRESRNDGPERDEPHPVLGMKHKYVDMMRKYGGLDDPRRVKKEEEKKELLLQTYATSFAQKNQAKLYSLMQDPATKWGKDKPHPGYESFHDDFDGDEAFGKYDRKVPDHFSGPGSGDDQFMNSMISKYALELSKPDGTPTGEFVFKYPHAKQAAYEIVDTHLGLKGAEAEDYLSKYFDKTWQHFDTAADGKIEAARMSGFFRFLCGNMQINLH